MKSYITEAYAAYKTDERGYKSGEYLKFFPFRAAAAAFLNGDCYANVCRVDILNLEDEKYILRKQIDKNKVKFKPKICAPVRVIEDYICESHLG